MKTTNVPATMATTATANRPSTNGMGTSAISMVEYTDGTYQEPLVVAPYGLHGTGKSRLGATGPGDLYAIPLDQKAKQTIISTCKELGKRLFLPNVDLVRVNNVMQAAVLKPFCQVKDDGMDARKMATITQAMDIFKPQPMCCAIHYYRWHVNRVKHTLVEISGVRDRCTVLIDSGTNLWDDILFANHGRTDRINPIDRAPDNREMQEILGICRGKHLVITHKEGEVWKNNKPTGEVEWKGYGHLGYEVGAILHMHRDKKSGEFKADVEMCQANAALHGDAGKADETGLAGEGISMPGLGVLLYPDTEYTDWL